MTPSVAWRSSCFYVFVSMEVSSRRILISLNIGVEKPLAGEEANRMLKSASPMPTVSAFYGILIRMFFNDHAPPISMLDMASSRQRSTSARWKSSKVSFRRGL